MNNSKLALDSLTLSEVKEPDRIPVLRKREGELVRIIESLRKVENSDEWSSLKELVFGHLVEKLKTELFTEARKDEPDTLRLSRTNGQLNWARKYADLDKLANDFRLELTNIRRILYGNNPADGAATSS